MAYWIDHNNSYVPAGQISYMCDDSSDIPDLPTSSAEGKPMSDSVTHKKCKAGSFCLCIGDSSGWMLNSQDQWVEV